MIYTEQEKQKLDRVLEVFAEYLKQRDHCDIAWSNKIGYLILDFSSDIDSVTPIGTAEDLCREMLVYIMIDVISMTKLEHTFKELNAIEQAEILRRWQPYFEQLPEYEYLREELTSEWP